MRRWTSLVGNPAAFRFDSSESSRKTVSHKSNETVLIGLPMSPFLTLLTQIEFHVFSGLRANWFSLGPRGPVAGRGAQFPGARRLVNSLFGDSETFVTFGTISRSVFAN
jgi:hypothetical protein